MSISVIGYFYLFQQEKDQPQTFKLKIGEKGIYKGVFDLEIELIEVGKIKDVLNTLRFSEEQLEIIAGGECEEKDCKDILEDTYYVVKVKNLDWTSECGEEKEVIMTKNRIMRGYYDCPSFYTFAINPVSSSDKKVEFKIEYNPAGVE